MIVDDDEDVRESLRDLLEHVGFEVVLAAHGREALELLGRLEPCLLLVDLVMPVMDGWELLRELERRDPPLAVPIHISTSAPSSAPAGYPVLPKPVDVQRVLEVVRRHCG